jgi:hypothetical protein
LMSCRFNAAALSGGNVDFDLDSNWSGAWIEDKAPNSHRNLAAILKVSESEFESTLQLRLPT